MVKFKTLLSRAQGRDFQWWWNHLWCNPIVITDSNNYPLIWLSGSKNWLRFCSVYDCIGRQTQHNEHIRHQFICNSIRTMRTMIIVGINFAENIATEWSHTRIKISRQRASSLKSHCRQNFSKISKLFSCRC